MYLMWFRLIQLIISQYIKRAICFLRSPVYWVMHIWQNLGLSFFQPKNLNRQILTDDHDIYSHDKLHRVTCCNILSALRAVVALSLSSHDFTVLFFQKLVENDDIFTSQTPQDNLLTVPPHIESCCDGFLVQQGLRQSRTKHQGLSGSPPRAIS